MNLLRHDGSPWDLGDDDQARAKLAFRAGLPGAFAFDRSAHAFRVARRAGVSCADLLAPACSASWLVNSGVPSTTIRRWLEPPLADVLGELAEALASEPCAWASFTSEEHRALEAGLGVLATDARALGALTKILSALAPESVPMMPDAALRFARVLDDAPAIEPPPFDLQSAPATLFGPMMTWFTATVMAHEAELRALGRGVSGPPLDAAQVLDRLLWFDSEGHRHRGG